MNRNQGYHWNFKRIRYHDDIIFVGNHDLAVDVVLMILTAAAIALSNILSNVASFNCQKVPFTQPF